MVAVLVTLGVAMVAGEASGQPRTFGSTISAAARWAGVAPEILAAVVWVESRGHPWALNVDGATLLPQTNAQALSIVRAAGRRADIGLAQIHYPVWGPVFGLRPEDLLDPWVNLHVAAGILRLAIAREPGSWGGVGRYHSTTPWRKWQYARRVAETVRALQPIPAPRVGPPP